MEFVLGIVLGTALAMLVLAFLSIGSYDRGFEDGLSRRHDFSNRLTSHEI